jgi:MFS family permease
MLYKPTATAHVADAAPDGMVGRFSSLYAAASISGMFLAPAIGGTVYDHAPRLLYPAAAVLAVAAAAVLYRQQALRKPATQPRLSGGGEPGAT